MGGRWPYVRVPTADTLPRMFAIAGLQLETQATGNVDAMIEELDLVKRRFPWLHMVLFGELHAFGTRTAHAEPLPGPTEQRFCEAARRTGLWVLPGTLFERAGDTVYNTAPVINPKGEVVLRYRKMFPFLPYEAGVSGGAGPGVFDVPGVGRFGVSICYDMWFPESVRALACAGAEVILHPSLTNTIDRDTELAIARANAAINQCYFFSLNCAPRLGFGKSAVYGPGGEPIHEAGSGREVIAVEFDLDYVRRVRRRGWNGLGQTLKSFRDCKVDLAGHIRDRAGNPHLTQLGPLVLPAQDTLPPQL
jgi:predicted amidohydrolase